VMLKFLIIGDSSVGKSCLLLRFTDDSFTTSFISTIGIDFKIKTILINGKRVKLQIWDTAGQERFHTITQAYYRGAMGIFLVYDITDAESFSNIRHWLDRLEQHSGTSTEKILVGNKCDLVHERAVSKQSGEKLAKDRNLLFFETSCADKTNVEIVFTTMAENIMKKKFNSNQIALGPGENLQGSFKKEAQCCK